MENAGSKCMCCGYELGTAPFCRICGKSPVSVTGGEVDSWRMEQMSRMYIHDKLKDIDILIKCYSYDCTEDSAAEEGEAYLNICSAEKYWVGDTFFSKISFEAIPSEREFTVDVRITGNGADRDYSLPMRPAQSLSHSRIGLCFTECMKARIVVGDGDNVCYSDEFELYIRDQYNYD